MRTNKDDSGAMLLATTFIMAAAALLLVVLSAVTAMTSNSRVAGQQQTDRVMLNAVLTDFISKGDNTGTSGAVRFNVSGARQCGSNTSLPNSDVKYKVCVTVEQQPGEDAYEGARLDFEIVQGDRKRYYTTHATGFHGQYMQDGFGIEFGAADWAGRSFGFSSEVYVDVASRGGGSYTYTPGTGNRTNGARLTSTSIMTGVTHTNKIRIFQAKSAGGSQGYGEGATRAGCWGAGCAGSLIEKVPANMRFFNNNAGLPFTAVQSLCVAPAGQAVMPVWYASQNGGVLNVPAEGLCFRGMVFDQNTTVINPTGAPIFVRHPYASSNYPQGGGAIEVRTNVSVNMNNASWPDPANLQIYTYGQVLMAPGSKFAGSIVAETIIGPTCTIRGTYYGSAYCNNGLDANAATLYYPTTFADAANPTGYLYIADRSALRFSAVPKSTAGF